MFENEPGYLHRIVVLTAPSIFNSLNQALTSEPIRSQMEIARIELLISVDPEAIASFVIPNKTTLLIFGSSRILSAEEIQLFTNRCFNLHAAPPSLPGRDPHHWAVYLGLAEYGATLHKIEPRVDSGEIYSVETFPIVANATPEDLLTRANELGVQIICANILEFSKAHPFSKSSSDQVWAERKFRRIDLKSVTKMKIELPPDEILLRVKAFSHSEHQNLSFIVGDYELFINQIEKLPE